MSYNYEINYSLEKKKNDNSKFIYKNNECDMLFIFELILTNNSNESTIIRKIKKNNHGNLLSSQDNILYNLINKYKLTVININNPDNPIIIKNNLNHNLSSNVFLNDKIYLEIIYNSNNLMEINFQIQ